MEQSSINGGVKAYKFKELKVYSSTEWLSGNKKRYRQVFDAPETGYVYAELTFHNKLFDEESWNANIELKCFKVEATPKNICALDFKRKISKHDPIIYIREGWGNKKEGMFWKKGTYYWEARINGHLVGTKYFYIVDSSTMQSPYWLSIRSLKLYEGQYDDVLEEDRLYQFEFSSEETRYIYLELTFDNLNAQEEWESEFFARFYNDHHELKGQVTRLRKIKEGETSILLSAGWGSNIKGSWKVGSYSIEVLFLGRRLATVHFEVGEEHLPGIPVVEYVEDIPGVLIEHEEEDNQTFEEIMIQLDALVGLQQIKSQVRKHAQYIQFLQLRKSKGFKEEESINVHSVFTGNPGTGKTTVAHLLGALYKKMGLLTKGHIHEVDRADLVGEYIGQTAPKVKEQIEKARGGVLFIDEAYALARSKDDTKDFGREVIEILVKEMSNGPGDLAVIVAGYPDEMKHFIDSNPGLQSRFKHYFEFIDYLPQELSLIADIASEKKEVILDKASKELLDERIIRAYRDRDKNFGNARFVYDLIEEAKINMGIRIMQLDHHESLEKEALMQIQTSDVLAIREEENNELPNIPIDTELLEESLADLDALIGISNIKKQIHELVSIIQYHKMHGKNVLNNFYMHTTFIGNPGTGKTTVARILTRIYKALGILERGHMVETDRQGLIAGFVGQTAIKTAEKIDEAMGGVLFIDEAYALNNFNGMQGDYGNEAIQTILKRMEDNRGKFFVFAAGYTDNMDKFLKANPGLSSRFDKSLIFPDYTPQELLLIAEKMITDQGYSIDATALNDLKAILEDLYLKRDKHFGNARSVRNTVTELIKEQNLRLASEGKTNVDTSLVTSKDVALLLESKAENTQIKKPGIGFNHG